MGALTTDEELATGLARAHELVERGEYGAALDALTGIWEAARARDDAAVLNEVRLLAEHVSERALGRRDRQRADAFRQAVADEVDAAPWSSKRRRSGAMKYFVWSLLVWAPVLVLATVAIATDPCPPEGCFGPSGTDIGVGLLLLAVPVYLIGLLVIWMWHRACRPSLAWARNHRVRRRAGRH